MSVSKSGTLLIMQRKVGSPDYAATKEASKKVSVGVVAEPKNGRIGVPVQMAPAGPAGAKAGLTMPAITRSVGGDMPNAPAYYDKAGYYDTPKPPEPTAEEMVPTADLTNRARDWKNRGVTEETQAMESSGGRATAWTDSISSAFQSADARKAGNVLIFAILGYAIGGNTGAGIGAVVGAVIG